MYTQTRPNTLTFPTYLQQQQQQLLQQPPPRQVQPLQILLNLTRIKLNLTKIMTTTPTAKEVSTTTTTNLKQMVTPQTVTGTVATVTTTAPSPRVRFAPMANVVEPEKLVEGPHDYINLRHKQVVDINTSARRIGAIRIPWPQASAARVADWEARHSVYLLLSKGHQMTQRRMLWLADFPVEFRFVAFEKECFARRLAPTTAETYWGAWLGAASILGVLSVEDKKVASILKKRANAFPTRFPAVMLAEHMAKIRKRWGHVNPTLTTLIALAFICGQRISDVLQIARCNIEVTESYVSIKIVAGKVFSHIQPYPLVIRRGVYPAEELVEIKQLASARPYVASWTLEDSEMAAIRQEIGVMLDSADEELEMRSIRRGGLQMMARLMVPLPDILMLSQHRDVDMLLRYLDYGMRTSERTNNIVTVTEAMSAAL